MAYNVNSSIIGGSNRNSHNFTILDNWASANFILVDELFAKALRCLETCVLTNDNLWGKLFSSLESQTAFDEI